MNFAFLHKYASLMHFYRLSRALTPWLAGASAILFVWGLVGGLLLAPRDYQQGDSFRIMYVHVPAAWMSMFVYMTMAAAGGVALIWKLKIAEIVSRACAPLGATFTCLALATGCIWGKPMWGTWWVWDARLTSVFILFLMYLGIIALTRALDDASRAAWAAAIITLVGFINIPIIKFSVDWWHTLHQPASVFRIDGPTIPPAMLWPLGVMALGYTLLFAAVLLVRIETEVLARRLRGLRHRVARAELAGPA